MRRRHLQLRADLRGIGEPVRSAEHLAEGRLCVAGEALPSATLRAPIRGDDVLGYRLVGVIEPGASPNSRRKVIDVSVVKPFGLRLACGLTLRVRAARSELLTWPFHKGMRRLSKLNDAAREAVARAHPERLALIEKQFTVFWFEWVLPRWAEVRLLGRLRRVPRVRGAFTTYRTPPTEWELAPPRDRPLSVVAGDVREVLRRIGRHPRYMPERLVGEERPRRGPRIGL